VSLRKHPIVTALKWLLAAVAVYLVIRKVSIPDLWPTLKSAHLWPLFGSLTAILLSSVLNAYRWKGLLQAPNLGVLKYLYFVYVGHFFNLFMPSSVAAEAIKVIAFGKRYGNLQQNIGVTLVARGMGLLAQFLIGVSALVLYYRELSRTGLFAKLHTPWLVILPALGIAAAGIVVLYRMRGVLIRQAWIKAILDVSRDRPLMARTALLTVAIQILSAVSGYCLFLSVFDRAPFGKVVLFILIIQAILMIPFSMGGVGVREYLALLFFSDLGGMPREAVLAANLLGYVPLIVMAAMGGAWILFRKQGSLLKAGGTGAA
jgi:uncharacterized membrane protein YbhN (UPF0104 family)